MLYTEIKFRVNSEAIAQKKKKLLFNVQAMNGLKYLTHQTVFQAKVLQVMLYSNICADISLSRSCIHQHLYPNNDIDTDVL